MEGQWASKFVRLNQRTSPRYRPLSTATHSIPASGASSFYDDPNDPDALKIPKEVTTMSDSKGPIAFVRYTKSLRISCTWSDEKDVHRNAKSIIFGIRDAVDRARASGFTEIIIRSDSEKLSTFLTRVLRMDKQGNQHYLQV